MRPTIMAKGRRRSPGPKSARSTGSPVRILALQPSLSKGTDGLGWEWCCGHVRIGVANAKGAKTAGASLAEGHALAEQGRWAEAEASFAVAMKLALEASLTVALVCSSVLSAALYDRAGEAIEYALHYAVPILGTPESKGIEARSEQLEGGPPDV